MGYIAEIWIISRWEMKRVVSQATRPVLPLALMLLVALLLISGFAAQSGIHLQDGIYRLGTDDPALASLFSGDSRFTVYYLDSVALQSSQESFDLLITGGRVYARNTERASASLTALTRDYELYVAGIYSSQEDLFAAYPLWIDQQFVRSELSFQETEGGQYLGVRPAQGNPHPDGPVANIPEPLPTLPLPKSGLRQELAKATEDDPFGRYTAPLAPESGLGDFQVPSQIAPSPPFESIISVFVFIFPLYFIAQFFMMSIIGERIDRRGEILLAAPVRPVQIIAGKALPYFSGMCVISLVLAYAVGGSYLLLMPLLPVILFFLASALLIAMISRSFKELSFISIFFSTILTSYLFLPTIFIHVHVVSLVSPLTLVILALQGEGYTLAEYFYSTSLFFITSGVLFYVAVMNFQEERLFGQARFLPRIREFIDAAISRSRPYLSLVLMNSLLIPFVFMAQLLLLVVFFNLPMPLSLILLIATAALIEEGTKSVGIYTLMVRDRSFLSIKPLLIASAATALGFLAGEKIFLFAMLSQVTESIFGSVLFLSLQVLWIPFLLHFSGVLIVGLFLKYGGSRAYVPGLFIATVVHSLYNLTLIAGMG
jgi:ABC-type Na+ efflux pump permease subunit